MPSFARNTIYKKIGPDSSAIVLPVDDTVASIKEGTPCYWDATAKIAKPITLDAHVPFYCGIAQSTVPVTHHTRQKKKMSFYIGDCIVKLTFPAADALLHFAPVYIGATDTSGTITPGGKTEVLGHVYIEVDEFKAERTTTDGEEVTVLMRPSVFQSRVFA